MSADETVFFFYGNLESVHTGHILTSLHDAIEILDPGALDYGAEYQTIEAGVSSVYFTSLQLKKCISEIELLKPLSLENQVISKFLEQASAELERRVTNHTFFYDQAVTQLDRLRGVSYLQHYAWGGLLESAGSLIDSISMGGESPELIMALESVFETISKVACLNSTGKSTPKRFSSVLKLAEEVAANIHVSAIQFT